MATSSLKDATNLAESAGACWTPSDWARFLVIDVRSVRRMEANGRLPKADIRLGKLVRWRNVTVQRWLDQQKR